MHTSTGPVALGGLQLHDSFRESDYDEFDDFDIRDYDGDEFDDFLIRDYDGDEFDDFVIRDYDVAALAKKVNQAFRFGIYGNAEIDENLSSRQNTDSQQIVRPLENIGDSYNTEPDRSNFDQRTHERRKSWRQKVSLEWIFVITNFVLELPSVVPHQLSLVHKPQYALFAMFSSFAALFICVVELIYKGRKEKIVWRWKGMLPWFYNASQNYKPFGTFEDIIGPICVLCQCIVTAVNCAQADTIKISVWPIIFAFGLLCSKMLENPERRIAV